MWSARVLRVNSIVEYNVIKYYAIHTTMLSNAATCTCALITPAAFIWYNIRIAQDLYYFWFFFRHANDSDLRCCTRERTGSIIGLNRSWTIKKRKKSDASRSPSRSSSRLIARTSAGIRLKRTHTLEQ